jgi:prepilin-type N-terminal cleavage/methylation domain-containing protein
MYKNLKQHKQSGFTIIEVLIVLAIAGLIISIVLFAVPALQRNGRNTAIKSDANQIVGYISDFVSNNDGAIPNSVDISSGTVTVSGAIGQPATGAIQKGTSDNTALSGAQSTITPTIGTVTIVTAAKCGTGSGTSYSTVASPRTVAVVYSIETSSTNLAKCVSN